MNDAASLADDVVREWQSDLQKRRVSSFSAQCIGCGETKPDTEFYRYSDGSLRARRCKVCKRKEALTYWRTVVRAGKPAGIQQRAGKKDKNGLTQYDRHKRNDAIWKLAGTVVPRLRLTIQQFSDVVRKYWPEKRNQDISRICTSAGVQGFIHRPEPILKSSSLICETCGKLGLPPRYRRFCSRKCLDVDLRKRRNTGRLVGRPKKKTPTARGPIQSDSEQLSIRVAQSDDRLIHLAFKRATELSWTRSAELVGPIWEGMFESHQRGVSDDAGLIMAGEQALRKHARTLSDPWIRSLDQKKESTGFEPIASSAEEYA